MPESEFQEPENQFLHDPVMLLDQHNPVDEILEFPSGDSTCEDQINLKPGSNIKSELIQWALKYSIPHVALTDLLILLKNELKLEELPRDSRTLIGTPSSCSIVPMGDGHFWYNGIQNNLYQQSFLTELNKDKDISSISLIFNIDGLPPFNSSPLQYWPILLKEHEYPKLKPMAIAIYCGPTKPPIQEYFKNILFDSLHLFDLGIMKKCLNGWVYGNYNFKTKFSGRDIEYLSEMLISCNIRRPTELHRAIRPLKNLKFWKGSEYRTFLLYLGPVLLKDILAGPVYQNYIYLFCATTSLSYSAYLKHINVAEKLLFQFFYKI
ncbi:uncharacterized protein LOC126750340 [Anthonomus grandis grandis]|uniref:uncharacterized protein LOC126750340 n=1 Tax=Anthonomus grandis grandis TaxID=2921223 RepID=UPI002166B0F8|nr:uncharacterized protein LOC126750340 [Anthonomus grandis grandis]